MQTRLARRGGGGAFEPLPVRVADAERSVLPLRGGAVRRPLGEGALERVERGGVAELEAHLAQARSAFRRRPGTLALPRVQSHVVVIPAGRQESSRGKAG